MDLFKNWFIWLCQVLVVAWDLYSYLACEFIVVACEISVVACGIRFLTRDQTHLPGSSAPECRSEPLDHQEALKWASLVLHLPCFYNLSLNDLILSLLLVPVRCLLILCGCHCCCLPNNFTSDPFGYMTGLYLSILLRFGACVYFGRKLWSGHDFLCTALTSLCLIRHTHFSLTWLVITEANVQIELPSVWVPEGIKMSRSTSQPNGGWIRAKLYLYCH